jgi:choline dehydrogenase-like flavoprotein
LHDDNQVWECAKTKEPSLGDDLHISFSHYCPENRFVRVFADTFEDEQLTVMLHANVVEMIPSEDKRQIASLRFRSLEGKESTCTAKQIVLCLGGIESSRFLLNQSFAPWNEHGLVGRYFQDHIHCFAADVCNANLQSSNWPYGPWPLNGQYLPKIKMTPAAQQKYGVLNVAGTIEYCDGIVDTIHLLATVLAGPTSAIGFKEFISAIPRVPAVIWHHFNIKKNSKYLVPWAKPKLSVWCEQSPLSESRISLSRKRDKLGLLEAEIAWQISELEINTIRKYVEVVKQSFAAQGIAQIIPDRDLYNDNILKKCTDFFHHCGGTRMAVQPHHGVVDPNLRLHGVKNAYVCSSSVFPTSGFTHPTHTIMALAVRLAEHLSGKLAGPGIDRLMGTPSLAERSACQLAADVGQTSRTAPSPAGVARPGPAADVERRRGLADLL